MPVALFHRLCCQPVDGVINLLQIGLPTPEILSRPLTPIQNNLLRHVIEDYLVVFIHQTKGIREREECKMRGGRIEHILAISKLVMRNTHLSQQRGGNVSLRTADAYRTRTLESAAQEDERNLITLYGQVVNVLGITAQMVGNQYHKRVLPQRQLLQFVHEMAHAAVGISKRVERLVIQTVVRNIKGFVAA